MAVVVVRNKRTGAAVRYTVADTWIPKLAEWNRTLEPRARYDEVMKADNLFEAAVENKKAYFAAANLPTLRWSKSCGS